MAMDMDDYVKCICGHSKSAHEDVPTQYGRVKGKCGLCDCIKFQKAY